MTTYYAGVEKIDENNLKKFFMRFGTYFQDQDVKHFLNEAKLLMRKDELIDLNEIASMIRNDIECMPK
jgi:hypothetical protein